MGAYTGSSDGTIIVNIDERSSHYQGVAYLTEANNAIPNTMAAFRTPDQGREFRFRTDFILPISPHTGQPVLFDTIKQNYAPDVTVSSSADVTGSWDEASLSLRWTTDIGVTGGCVLLRSKADQPSELVSLEMKWEEYKAHVVSLEEGRFLFRGQEQPWRLRTKFHRAGRADLTRFLREDIQVLHRRLSARTKHIFNLLIPDENGAFLNLVQHHGYPTPLLDWTHSPYVAAFFAYRGIANEKAAAAAPVAKVRIHVLDQGAWKADLNQLFQLLTAGPHLSIHEFIAIENERMIPQQAASTITNVDDIESYVRTRESSSGKTYLKAIDLPVRDRRQVVRELGHMGITAGSLFPGLDGACEELRERNFET
jgi:hypothetical protein